jgi:hypothetical protein
MSAAHDALHALESMGVIECVKRESLVIQQHATATYSHYNMKRGNHGGMAQERS